MNIEEELSKLLSEELAKSIDAEILNNLISISKENIRKKSIDKIFKASKHFPPTMNNQSL